MQFYPINNNVGQVSLAIDQNGNIFPDKNSFHPVL